MAALMRAMALGVVVTAAALTFGCSASSPLLAACNTNVAGEVRLRARLSACTAAIKLGAKGDDLEQALVLRGETYQQLADNDHAVADFDQALRLNTRDSRALNDRGLVFLARDKLTPALSDFNAAIGIDPEKAYPFNNRGLVEIYSRDYDAAIGDENRAIGIKPAWATPWANRGYAYSGKRQWEMALADFNDALRLAPGYAWAMSGKAGAELAKGQTDLAIKDLNQILATSPGNGNALLQRAEIHSETGDFAGAMRDANEAIALHPGEPNPYAYRSDFYLRSGDHTRALADAETAVQLRPDDPQTLNLRCWTRAVIGADFASALADCQRALALRPNWNPALDSVAFIQFRQGRFEQAISGYDAVLAREPQNPSARFMRGVAKLRAGDKGGAADVAAASAADARVVARYAALGVKATEGS
jgi:tetratricopeptide (TPR) repeat protein